MGALTHDGEVLQRLPADASQINFDKTGTNLNSTQVENAIKEVNTKVNTNTTDIDQLKSGLTNVDNKFTTPQSLPNAGVLTDANDVSKTCISVVNSLTANLPSGIVTSCPMITLMGSADLGWGAYDMGIQILITNSGRANGNYYRVKYTNNWYPWGNF